VDDNAGTMALFEQEAHSFVIRMWRERHESKADWRGWIQHVQSGNKYYFRDETTFCDVMSTYLSTVPPLEEVFISFSKQSDDSTGKQKS
jgi:hypothetical protein